MKNRRSTGFSLVAIAALGVVAMMWLFGMSASVLPMYRRASISRYYTVVRSAAEAGLDYTVAELNKSLEAGETSSYDDTSTDGSPKTFEVPQEKLGNSASVVTIAVNNIEPPTTSSIYDPQLDAPNISSGVMTNGWRVVTATSSYAGLQKSIRVVLQPTYQPGGTVTVPTPYFTYAMFGKALISMSGNAMTDSYNSANGAYTASPSTANRNPYGGDVGSNTMGALSGNASIGGDLRIYSSPKNSSTNVVAIASSTVQVLDQVVLNGVSTGFTATSGEFPVAGDNVQAMGGGSPRVGDYTSPIDSSQSYDPASIPAAKSIPSDATVKTGRITWSGSNGYVAQPATNEVVDLSSISLSGTRNLHLQPGMYKVSSLSIAGQAKITLDAGSDGQFGPVQMFVEGNVPGSNVIQVTGNGILNSSQVPGNLQIWYNGSKTVMMAGNGALHGVVYAPNADVRAIGNGQYYGAVVANTVLASGNAGVHFDEALGTSGANWGLTYNQTGTAQVLSTLKTISWQEL